MICTSYKYRHISQMMSYRGVGESQDEVCPSQPLQLFHWSVWNVLQIKTVILKEWQVWILKIELYVQIESTVQCKTKHYQQDLILLTPITNDSLLPSMKARQTKENVCIETVVDAVMTCGFECVPTLMLKSTSITAFSRSSTSSRANGRGAVK